MLSGVFLTIHVSLRVLHFCNFLLPFSFFLFSSYLVSFGLSESRLVLVRPVPVSVGLLLVFPGPSRPLLEDNRKKEEVTRSYTFLVSSYLVSVGPSSSRLVLVGPVPVSTGLLLVFPGPPRPPLEDYRKKEEVTKSYTFRSEDCNIATCFKTRTR